MEADDDCVVYKKRMVELTKAQRVNRFVEEAFSGKRPSQWAVFPSGTIVMLSGASMLPQTLLASRAGEILHSSGIEGDTFDSIQFVEGGLLVDFTAAKRDRPRGVRIFGVFPNIETISSCRATADYSTRLAPVLVNCNTPLPPSIVPGEYDEEEGDDDEDFGSNLSDDTGIDMERRLRSCDPGGYIFPSKPRWLARRATILISHYVVL